MPDLYIISGSNGAGKSTIGQDYVPVHVMKDSPIFDGDKLYMQKHSELWASGMRINKQIREIANDFVAETFNGLVENALKNKTHFAYEGHFTETSSWNIPKEFKMLGYSVNMIFFALNDTKESELRVLERVKDGGHNVPRLMIENNFYGNLEQLDKHFFLLDSLLIFDTSTLKPLLLAEMADSRIELTVPQEKLPNWFHKYLPDILRNATLRRLPSKHKGMLPPNDKNSLKL